MAAHYKEPEHSGRTEKFEPRTDPRLARQLTALEARFEQVRAGAREEGQLASEARALVASRVMRRIEAVKDRIAASHALQEVAWKRARGLLPLPRGMATEYRVEERVGRSRAGVRRTSYVEVPKFAPSTSVPRRSERRRARRAVEYALDQRISGRQWRRLRKALKRAGDIE